MSEHKAVPNIRFKGFEDKWRRITISEVGSVTTGNTPSTKQARYYSKKGVPWITPSNIEKNGKVYNVKHLSNEGEKIGRIVPKGSVLVTSIASIGKNTLLKEDSAFNQQINAITPNKKYNSYFLYTACNQVSKKMKDIASAGTMQIVNKKEFSRMLIICPLLLEQKKIGNFFAKLDKLLDLQQQKIDKLELLKKALLQKLFPKHDADIPELRFKGFNDEWKSYLLGKIAVFINGRAFKQNELLDKGKYPVLRVGNFYTNDKWFYSDLELPEKLYANKGDLLYTWSATFGPHIWKGDKVIYHYHIWKIIFSSEVSKQFALQMLLNDKEELMNNTNGSTMIHLTKNEMEKKVVKIPIKPEQQKIGNLLSKVDQLIELENKKLQDFQQVKKCLLQNMFVE